MEDYYYTVDSAFTESIGELGAGQLYYLLMVNLAGWIPGAFFAQLFIFVNMDPVAAKLWRCVNPEDPRCAAIHAAANPYAPAAPPVHAQPHQVAPEPPGFCSLRPSEYVWTHASYSIVSEFGLVCGSAWRNDLVVSLQFAGFMVGSVVFGRLADAVGRRPTLFCALGLMALTGVATAAAPSYWLHATCRFLAGGVPARGQDHVGARPRTQDGTSCITTGGTGTPAAVLSTELVGPSWRGTVGIACQLFFTVGSCLQPVLAFHVPSWRRQTLLYSATACCGMLTWPFTIESPRWLLTRGRPTAATAALAKLAAGNKRPLPPGPLTDPILHAMPVTFYSLLRRKRLALQLASVLYAWLAVSLAYYGIAMNLGAIAGSLYWNAFSLAAIEVPSLVLVMVVVDRAGRRPLVAAGFLAAAGGCAASGLLRGPPQRGASVLGKFGAAMSFDTLYFYTGELMPTYIRTSVVGAGSFCARVGSLVAPGIILAARTLSTAAAAFFAFAAAAVVAAILMLPLPETRGRHLPETVDDAVALSRTRKKVERRYSGSSSNSGLLGEQARG